MVNPVSIGKKVRAIAWALIWDLNHPEISSMNEWIHDPKLVAMSIMLYLISSVILEMSYRLIVWGGLAPHQINTTAIRPECPEHPWISMFDKWPPELSEIEVFCADGISRRARTNNKTEEGILLFEIAFEESVLKKQQQNPWRYRPTHWRKPK